MKVWVISFILFINMVIQSAIFPFIQINGNKPDTLITLVVCFGILAGNMTGMVVGLFGGILQDILYGNALGVYALQYMLIGYMAGFLYERVYMGRIVLPVFIVFTASILRQLIMYVYAFFIRADFNFLNIFFNTILMEAIYTALIMPLIFWGMTMLYKKKFMRKKWHFK